MLLNKRKDLLRNEPRKTAHTLAPIHHSQERKKTYLNPLYSCVILPPAPFVALIYKLIACLAAPESLSTLTITSWRVAPEQEFPGLMTQSSVRRKRAWISRREGVRGEISVGTARARVAVVKRVARVARRIVAVVGVVGGIVRWAQR